MSCFWAKFQSINKETFRFNTRIYLNNIDIPSNDDFCIGAIVGKNPGSAKPSLESEALQPIELDGDKLLPTVKNIITKAYIGAGVPLPERGYIQVLNLFYLCNQNLAQAISSIEKHSAPPRCLSEFESFPWIWYVWGGELRSLDLYKDGFSTNAKHHFFFDGRNMKIKEQFPNCSELAKHTQGLKHDYVVPYISKIIIKEQVSNP